MEIVLVLMLSTGHVVAVEILSILFFVTFGGKHCMASGWRADTVVLLYTYSYFIIELRTSELFVDAMEPYDSLYICK